MSEISSPTKSVRELRQWLADVGEGKRAHYERSTKIGAAGNTVQRRIYKLNKKPIKKQQSLVVKEDAGKVAPDSQRNKEETRTNFKESVVSDDKKESLSSLQANKSTSSSLMNKMFPHKKTSVSTQGSTSPDTNDSAKTNPTDSTVTMNAMKYELSGGTAYDFASSRPVEAIARDFKAATNLNVQTQDPLAHVSVRNNNPSREPVPKIYSLGKLSPPRPRRSVNTSSSLASWSRFDTLLEGDKGEETRGEVRTLVSDPGRSGKFLRPVRMTTVQHNSKQIRRELMKEQRGNHSVVTLTGTLPETEIAFSTTVKSTISPTEDEYKLPLSPTVPGMESTSYLANFRESSIPSDLLVKDDSSRRILQVSPSDSNEGLASGSTWSDDSGQPSVVPNALDDCMNAVFGEQMETINHSYMDSESTDQNKIITATAYASTPTPLNFPRSSLSSSLSESSTVSSQDQSRTEVKEVAEKFGGTSLRGKKFNKISAVERRKEELERQWAGDRKPVATRKTQWQACSSTGTYKKKVVLKYDSEN